MNIVKTALTATVVIASLGLVIYLTRRTWRATETEGSENAISDYKEIFEMLAPVWKETISPTITSTFGKDIELYAIIYQSGSKAEAIVEIWDPKGNLPSEVFRLKNVRWKHMRLLAATREQAQVIILTDHVMAQFQEASN